MATPAITLAKKGCILIDYNARYGEWALVLGGSEGLGRAVACELSARRMNVALAARRDGPLREAAELISKRYGAQTRTFQIDLAADDVVARVASAKTSDGRLIDDGPERPRPSLAQASVRSGAKETSDRLRLQ